MSLGIDHVSNTSDIHQGNGLLLLGPTQRGWESLVLLKTCISFNAKCSRKIDSEIQQEWNLPKKYSTQVRLTVPAVISPKTIIGAATSPKLKCSVVSVKV